jgi:hypothetical protein
MIALLLAAAISAAPQPAPARAQGIATARIVSGERVQLDSPAAVASAQRTQIVRRQGDGQVTRLRLVEFQ